MFAALSSNPRAVVLAIRRWGRKQGDFQEYTLPRTNMEVENHLFVVDFHGLPYGVILHVTMLVPGSVVAISPEESKSDLKK